MKRWHGITAAVSFAVLVIIAALLLGFGVWSLEMEPGTWGEWVSGIGTVLAVFAAIGIAWWEGRRQRTRDMEAQARAIHAWAERRSGATEDYPDDRYWTALFHNSSDKPVFSVRLQALAWPSDKEFSVPLVEPLLPGLTSEPILTHLWHDGVIEALPDEDDFESAAQMREVVARMHIEPLWWEFTDARGVRWRCDNKSVKGVKPEP